MSSYKVGAVVIGRNEGDRLKRCLASVQAQVDHVVYVDSGSSDGSVAHARSIGVHVVELDRDVPFTAARARNAGADAFTSLSETVDYIQFVDGDCTMLPGWVDAAAGHLHARPDLGIVTGWLAELEPDRTVYNAMCDFEWRGPVGPIKACGGILMVRRDVFIGAGGFNPLIIAAEDDEFCIRVRQRGFGIERLPLEMAQHDVAMTRFSEWWRRSTRTGHAFAQIDSMYPGYFRSEMRRVLVFAVLVPILFICGMVLLATSAWAAGTALIALCLMAYLASWLRTVRGLMHRGLGARKAMQHGVFMVISKFPNLVGAMKFFIRRFLRKNVAIIEYK